MGQSAAGDELVNVFRKASEECLATDNLGEGFRQASDVRDTLDGLVGQAAELRAEIACRLMEAEGLSTAQLATRLGVSKSRAGQLVLLAREVRSRAHDLTMTQGA